MHDQNAIVRQYMKWTRRIEMQDSPGFMVSRAMQVALTPPRGPVYLSVPREIAASQEECGAFPTVQELQVPALRWTASTTTTRCGRSASS